MSSLLSLSSFRAFLVIVFAVPMAVMAVDPTASDERMALRTKTAEKLADWNYWSPRPELAQDHDLVTRDGAPALMLRSRGFASYGYWLTRLNDVQGGSYYHFEALHQAEDLPGDTGSVFAVLSWYGGPDNRRELQRDYIDRREAAGDWLRFTRTVKAPENATTVRIELGLRRASAGTVYWRDVRLEPTAPPAPRIMKVATTRILPKFPATMEANLGLMEDMLERIGPEKPDFVLLSENLLTRGVKLPLEQKAQTIPGPFTRMLSEKARKFGVHIITTLLEVDGNRYHNTAVLVDRQGRIAGKYRKVHLTIGEMESGLTPGNDYPVFETDAGRIGIVTCWDNWFLEPMRILRLHGAEVVFMPLAGDGNPAHWDSVWRARAMDNGVYLVTSSTVSKSPSRIIAPTGEVMAETINPFAHVVSELDLNREWRLRYLSVGNGDGEARSLYLRERRPETYAPLLEDEQVRPAPGAGI